MDIAQAAVHKEALSADAELLPPWSRTLSMECDAPLLYSDFYAWQLGLLERPRGHDGLGASKVPLRSDLGLKVNKAKGARVGSVVYETEEFRKVRMTYFDAGNKVQVFNSLWYPRECCGDVPVLGIDLLCFGGAKILAVVDCQPLSGRPLSGRPVLTPEEVAGIAALASSSSSSSSSFSSSSSSTSHSVAPPETTSSHSLFAAIRDKYPSLCGTMSSRFYDANQFFSNAMLYGRFESTDTQPGAAAETGGVHPIEGELFPAYKEYVGAYVGLVQAAHKKAASAGKASDVAKAGTASSAGTGSASGSASGSAAATTMGSADTSAAAASATGVSAAPGSLSWVAERQRLYDQYSAERDPAHGLFTSYFGRTWAGDFMHTVLFDRSDVLATAAYHAQHARTAAKQGGDNGGGGGGA